MSDPDLSGSDITSQAEEVAGSDSSGNEVDAVFVGRLLTRSTTTATKIRLSLVTGMGELVDGQRVLVPFLDCECHADSGGGGMTAPHDGQDADGGQILTARMTLDNVAFMLEQIATHFADLLDPLEAMLLGNLKAPPGRLEFAADKVAAASERLGEAASDLRRMAGREV